MALTPEISELRELRKKAAALERLLTEEAERPPSPPGIVEIRGGTAAPPAGAASACSCRVAAVPRARRVAAAPTGRRLAAIARSALGCPEGRATG